MRAPGSKLTSVALSRAGASFSMIGVCSTRPVKYLSGAMMVGTLPQAMIFIVSILELMPHRRWWPLTLAAALCVDAARDATASGLGHRTSVTVT
ncbi:hypothetical protein MPL3356_330026 [Mesorhizobium plurifarium]|uniref:Uncharacterized protein n=1 Tax=Mesorhizobium plurifarium TaxID=69974 RepID=A0A090E1Q1_MESPL|nr:hypothetical protein MPL3356_330026 [Mesorhizobium plurifarium]